MTVTDGHVAALRALLAGDFDQWERLVEELDRTDGWGDGYPLLINAAFFHAVDRRFGKDGTHADVVRFVAETRARFDPDGQTIDPHAAELLVRSVLEPDAVAEAVAGLGDATVVETEGVLLGQLITVDERLAGEQLDEFIAEARKLADECATGE